MPLIASRYGKEQVRVMRLTRDGDHHTPRELTLSVMLTGRFDAAWTEGDNRACIATDSIKNIVNVTAARNLALDKEAFVAAVARVLLDTYPQIEMVAIEAEETRWLRHSIDGQPHGHTFTRDGNGVGFVALVADRAGSTLRSGLRGYTFMKTTQSGWTGFVADQYRTLPDTTDRIAATSMDATWTWAAVPAACETANARILATLLAVFGTTYSRGVQDSMYRMGEAALAAVQDISEITFVMPNKHYIPVDLTAFSLDNPGTVFLPTDQPYGRIEATVSRGG
ncbi:Uricase [Methylobacterium tardum]|uniref:Uricase n=1 Tax=Methylobacterium tardum TaxID=374432 RepID=A0AA37TGY3_9HYPH|nr:urate oxidase [Methylobacterium tardum]URD37224.1 urate oxidase [Methylobacterium tardum]GJE51962.1 Uricase [Methylobacterium tardum]GLS70898.1 uricase [Methylobacterium tardum]